MDIKELKARAYDLLATIEAYQGELQRVNNEIGRIQATKQEDSKGKKEKKANH